MSLPNQTNVFEIEGSMTYRILDGVTLFAKENAVQKLADAGPTGIDPNDIEQGWLGDCFFLLAVMSLAKSNPQFIQSMITENLDGSYSAQLYPVVGQVIGGRLTPVAGARTTIRVENPLNRNAMMVQLSNDFDAGTGKMEIWTAVLEQAYAKLIGGYDPGMQGGDITFVWAALTGEAPKERGVYDMLNTAVFAEIQAALAAGKPVVLTTDTPISQGSPIPPKHGCLVHRIVGQTLYVQDPTNNLREIEVSADNLTGWFNTFVVFPLIP